MVQFSKSSAETFFNCCLFPNYRVAFIKFLFIAILSPGRVEQGKQKNQRTRSFFPGGVSSDTQNTAQIIWKYLDTENELQAVIPAQASVITVRADRMGRAPLSDPCDPHVSLHMPDPVF